MSRKLDIDVNPEFLQAITKGFLIGIWISIIIVAGYAIYDIHVSENSRMPANFSLQQSRDAVSRALPGNCINTENDTYNDAYVFECRQNLNNYTYITTGRVEYNATGREKVYVFN